MKYIFYVRSKFVLKNILLFSHWTHKCKQCLFFGIAQWRRRIFHKKANAYYLCYDNHFTPSEPLDMEIGPRFSDEEYNPSESCVRWLWGQKTRTQNEVWLENSSLLPHKTHSIISSSVLEWVIGGPLKGKHSRTLFIFSALPYDNQNIMSIDTFQ